MDDHRGLFCLNYSNPSQNFSSSYSKQTLVQLQPSLSTSPQSNLSSQNCLIIQLTISQIVQFSVNCNFYRFLQPCARSKWFRKACRQVSFYLQKYERAIIRQRSTASMMRSSPKQRSAAIFSASQTTTASLKKLSTNIQQHRLEMMKQIYLRTLISSFYNISLSLLRSLEFQQMCFATQIGFGAMLDSIQHDSRRTIADQLYRFAQSSYTRPSQIIYSMYCQFSVEKLPSTLKHDSSINLSALSLARLIIMGINPLSFISYRLPFLLFTYLLRTKRQSEIKPILSRFQMPQATTQEIQRTADYTWLQGGRVCDLNKLEKAHNVPLSISIWIAWLLHKFWTINQMHQLQMKQSLIFQDSIAMFPKIITVCMYMFESNQDELLIMLITTSAMPVFIKSSSSKNQQDKMLHKHHSASAIICGYSQTCAKASMRTMYLYSSILAPKSQSKQLSFLSPTALLNQR